jgi:hypothetical protein
MTDLNVTQRLERLEQENRRLKRIGATALLAVGALFLMGQTAPKPKVHDLLRTRALVVVNAKGEPRALMQVTDDDTATLSLGGFDARARLMIAATPDGRSSLALLDRQRVARAEMTLTEGKGVALMLRDKTGSAEAIGGVEDDGSTYSLWTNKDVAARKNQGP